MSSLIVNFPDCGELTSPKDGETMTVTTSHCAPAGPPPVIGAWEIAAFIIVGVAAVAGISMVRYRAQELKPQRLQERRLSRKQEIDGQIALAQAHKQCMMCGSKYEPELES